jgi:type I restriction enzyme S subunit
MSKLPSRWADAPMGDLLMDIEAGRSFKCSERPAGPDEWGVIKVSAMTWREFDEGENKAVLRDHQIDPRFEIQSGDLLFSRANTVTYVGAVVQVGETRPRLLLSDKSLRLVPHHSVSPRWLLYYLRTRQARQYLESLATGTKDSMRNISQASLRGLPVPLAPRREQERVVAAIEEQFSRLDTGVATLKRVQLNLKRMRAQGVSSLFDPLWPRVPLADVLTLISDCPHRTPTYTDGEGYPALRPRDVVGGKLRLHASARVSPQEYRLQTARHTPEAGDIVYSRELSYGWAVELPEGPPVCLSQGMVLLKATRLLPGFLALFLNSYEGRQQADRAATGTAHPHINLRDIKQYQVPLAPHTDQRRVIALASDLLSECDRASQTVAAAMIRAEALRNAVLSYAFSGKLVAQNPNDEPASALLERITAERESSNGNAPKRTRRTRVLREEITA